LVESNKLAKALQMRRQRLCKVAVNLTRESIVLRRKLLARSWKLGLYEDELKLPSGKIQLTPRLTLPDFVVVIALRQSDERIPLVHQYRHGSRQLIWELPAGHIESRERPLESAKREFQEEIGYDLLSPKLVCSAYISPPRSKQRAHIFLGQVGKKIRQKLDETEYLKVKFVSPSVAERLLEHRVSAIHLLAFNLARNKGLFEKLSF
jgi:ADP-ribose pyrophosphatase